MCKKQTSVSHSSTESEIISLDAGLRLDGIPALDLWDLIVSVLRNTIQTPERLGRPVVTDMSVVGGGTTEPRFKNPSHYADNHAWRAAMMCAGVHNSCTRAGK